MCKPQAWALPSLGMAGCDALEDGHKAGLWSLGLEPESSPVMCPEEEQDLPRRRLLFQAHQYLHSTYWW